MWNLEVCNLEVNTALTGHRTTQIERSHRTWKSFMKFDALTEYGAFLDQHEGCDWVAGLPVYQHLYNTTHHTSIG